MGPGHYPGTPLPGQPGNVGIAGHRTTFGAPFFRFNEMSRGDLLLLTDTSGTTWVYGVVRQWVVARAIRPSSTERASPCSRLRRATRVSKPLLGWSSGRLFWNGYPGVRKSPSRGGHSRDWPSRANGVSTAPAGPGHASAADHRRPPPVILRSPQMPLSGFGATGGSISARVLPTVGSAVQLSRREPKPKPEPTRQRMGVAGHYRFRVAGLVRMGRDPHFCRPFTPLRRSSCWWPVRWFASSRSGSLSRTSRPLAGEYLSADRRSDRASRTTTSRG